MEHLLNTVTQGDCLTLLAEVPDESINMVMTSPPYDNLRHYKGYSFHFEGIARELWRVIKLGGVVVWVVSDATVNGSETGTSFKQALFFKQIGFNLHDTMIWSKGSSSTIGSLTAYQNAFEYMFVFSKEAPTTCNLLKDRPNKGAGRKITGTKRCADGSTIPKTATCGAVVAPFGKRLNIWDVTPERSRSINHPAMYPVELAADHIATWSNPGDIVLDPFFGSGTTGVACFNLGRNFIGMEISQEYCELAQSRLSKL